MHGGGADSSSGGHLLAASVGRGRPRTIRRHFQHRRREQRNDVPTPEWEYSLGRDRAAARVIRSRLVRWSISSIPVWSRAIPGCGVGRGAAGPGRRCPTAAAAGVLRVPVGTDPSDIPGLAPRSGPLAKLDRVERWELEEDWTMLLAAESLGGRGNARGSPAGPRAILLVTWSAWSLAMRALGTLHIHAASVAWDGAGAPSAVVPASGNNPMPEPPPDGHGRARPARRPRHRH